MAAVLTNETLKDEIAVSVAQVLASANRKAKELGVDLKESLITVTQHLANGVWGWRVHAPAAPRPSGPHGGCPWSAQRQYAHLRCAIPRIAGVGLECCEGCSFP